MATDNSFSPTGHHGFVKKKRSEFRKKKENPQAQTWNGVSQGGKVKEFSRFGTKGVFFFPSLDYLRPQTWNSPSHCVCIIGINKGP